MQNKISNQLPFSEKTGPLGERIKRLKQKYVQLWWEADCSFPIFHKTYSQKEQQEIEKEISRMIEKISDYMEHIFPTANDREAALRELVSLMEPHFSKLSNLSGITIDRDYGDGFIQSAKLFVDKIKQFDPVMKLGNVYQAMRNVWIMNSLQIFMDLAVGHSNSIFAYSMLYPYTDNIMDDVSVSFEDKLRMNRNLKQWLEGEFAPYRTDTEKRIYSLIKLIESEFQRPNFPAVFQSLLAIYNAQIRSLIQQMRDTPPYVIDILDISFEKGGTSVLADGYLIKGELNEKQEDFCFGFGAFLQLVDDIQDAIVDKQNSHMTLFSQIAGNYKLDMIANKLFHFISMVVELNLSEPHFRMLKEFIHDNSYLLVMKAIGKNCELYSTDYIRNIETHFPFTFSYMKNLKKKFKKIFSKQKKRTFNLDTVSTILTAFVS